MFCQKCGKQIPEDSRVCQYCGVPVMGQPQNMNANYQPTKLKKNPWKIIIPIVAVLLVIAIVIAVVVCVKKKEDKKLIEILGKYTDEPIVELICEDFDDNGEKEAYAVVGDSEEKEEYTEYIDADVYFVNLTEAEVIKEDVSGHSNGTIEVDDTIYVSFEIYDDEAETGHSYVYTIRENEPAEAEISGKYSDVHQDGMKIYATDANGQIIEIKLEPQKWEEAKEEDFKNFDKIINIHAVNVKNYSVDAPRAFSIAYDCLSGYDGYKLYSCFFDESDFEKHLGDRSTLMSTGRLEYENPDPLGRFLNHDGYIKFPADKIDWIIENVFGQQPDRNISAPMWYYYGDYFYSAVAVSEESFPTFETKYERLSDNRYKFSSSGKYHDGTEAKYGVEGVIGLTEADGKRIWKIFEINTFSTETGNSLVLDDEAAKYLGGTYSKIFEQYGNNFETFYYEGGDFVYYPDAYPLMGFCPSYDEGEDRKEQKDRIVKFILAWDTSHLYKDFYADMSYNELKEIVSGISRPQYSDYDSSYYTSFEFDGYRFTYCWFDEPDDNAKCAEVMISVAND